MRVKAAQSVRNDSHAIAICFDMVFYKSECLKKFKIVRSIATDAVKTKNAMSMRTKRETLEDQTLYDKTFL